MIFHYQTLIAASIGFMGVIISILANGWLARRQREKALEHRKQALLSAIRAELNVSLGTFNERVELLNKPSRTGYTVFPLKVFNQVYRELLGSIGSLDEKNAETVINIYLLIEELPDKMKLLAESENNSTEFIYFNNEAQRKRAKEVHEYYVKLVERALSKLS